MLSGEEDQRFGVGGRMTTRLYMALDLGTQSIKVAFFDSTGREVGLATEEYDLVVTGGDRIECLAETYWETLKKAVLRANKARLDHGHSEVAGISLSSQCETFVCLDEDLRPLRPMINWLDSRAIAEAEEFGSKLGLEEIYVRTGQVECVAMWPATKLLWLKRHEARLYGATRKFALLEDWFIFRLTGLLVGEYSIYPSSLLLDIQNLRWWQAALDELELDAKQLPELVRPGTVVGGLAKAAAEELGLAAGTPVIAGGMDQLLASVAGGNVHPGVVTELTGTSLTVTASLSEFPARDQNLPVCLHVVPDLYCIQLVGQTGGPILHWIRDNCYGEPGSSLGHPPYDAVIDEAARVAAGADGVVILPHLCGAYYPEFDLMCRGAIVGLDLGHTRAHVVRAALESIGYMLHRCIRGARDAGLVVSEVTSLGPASRSRLWRQIKADICDVTVYRVDYEEASLLGAAMLVAVAEGDFSSLVEAAGVMSARTDPVSPSLESRGVYRQRQAEYELLYQQLQPYFHLSHASNGLNVN